MARTLEYKKICTFNTQSAALKAVDLHEAEHGKGTAMVTWGKGDTYDFHIVAPKDGHWALPVYTDGGISVAVRNPATGEVSFMIPARDRQDAMVRAAWINNGLRDTPLPQTEEEEEEEE